MTRRFTHFILLLACMVMFSSCIHNDIPYARIQANFITLQAKGQDEGTVIDTVAMTATLTFPEEINLSAVQITGYSLSPGAQIVDNPFGSPVDLSKPLYVYLKLYQNWLWKIIGVQDIERYFDVEGQIGNSTIDVPGRRVVLYVPASADMASLKILKAKLGRKGSTMLPDIADGGTFDGRKPFKISVESFGDTEEWTVYVEQMTETVRTVSADAWTCVAWVYGQAEAGRDNGVEYRIAGSEEWTRVPKDDITDNGGAFTACIKHLSPQTAYQTRAYSGEDYGATLDFTTGSILQLPNSNFDQWWLDKKIWCPWAEDGTPYWGTGNTGAATLGQSNTVPTEDTPSGSGWAACLQTRFVGIGTLGKLAAGNIFVGSYVRTVGTNGVLSFGRPFTEHPVKLRGQFKYTTAPINYTSTEFKHMAGQPDTCVVWLALIDTAEPFEIRTAPNDRQLFDPNGDYVVAYGKMECAQTVSSYTPFEFEIKYNSTSRVPKYILITASASKYGDYFTGGAGSTLYIDDFELVYDY